MTHKNNLPPNLANFIAENTTSDQPHGLLYPLRDKTPLVIGLVQTLEPKILSAVSGEINEVFGFSIPTIWHEKPRWETSPMLKFALRLLSVPVGYHILPMVHGNVLSIAISTKTDSGDVGGVLKGATAPLLSLSGKMRNTEWEKLVFAQNTPDETLGVFLMYCRSIFPPNSDRYREYATKLVRLFGEQPPAYRGAREGGPTGPQKSPTNRLSRVKDGQYSQFCDVDLEEIPDEDPRQKEFTQAATAYEKELNPDYEPADEKRITYFEPFRHAQFINLTTSSIGIPRWIEIAAILTSVDKLLSPLREQARAVLLLGICAGWTSQLKDAIFLANETEVQEDILSIYPDGSVHIKPVVSVGRPDWYDQDPEKLDTHLLAHEYSQESYQLSLPPILRDCLLAVLPYADNGHLFPNDSYEQAMNALNDLLYKQIPSAEKITPGRLGQFFHACTNNYGLSWANRYAICGRPRAHHKMAINYTLLNHNSVQKILNHYTNNIIEHITDFVADNPDRFGTKGLPNWIKTSNIPPDYTEDYSGSWSTPKLDLIIDILALAQNKLAEPELPSHERHNWRVRLAGISGAIMMAMRDFDLDGLEIHSNQPMSGSSLAQKTKKRKDEDESWIEYIIPDIMQSLWWEVAAASAAHKQAGKGVLCLLDSDGTPYPFKVQAELDFLTISLGLPGVNIRAYGLRHLGRTLLHDAGLSDADLALVMNHWSNGYERWNAVRLSADFCGFQSRYNAACQIVAERLGLVPERWLS